MKILTLNTWQERGPWRARWELILKGLREYDADIVAFQEVFNMDWAREIHERSGYPYLAVSGEHSGLIFLSKFRPVEQECLVMKTKSPTEDYLRYAFYVQVDTGKENVVLFNTHLSWKADENEIRMMQTLELEAFVMKKAGNLPVALMGDLNAGPDTPSVTYLREKLKWCDTFGAKNPGDPGFTWDYRNPYTEAERGKMAERRIDFIFIREQAGPFEEILSSRLVFNEPSLEGIYPSDHFGVMTEFSDQRNGGK
ncbi:MAG: endonuclease/exonuclease/phosphatase family protein [Candidatus Omnitrophota bacterium]|jgi:endonuclease/exonuclease/phosphatase family metal-dependent hydrolase